MCRQTVLRDKARSSARKSKIRCTACFAQHGQILQCKSAKAGSHRLEKSLLGGTGGSGGFGAVFGRQSLQKSLLLRGEHMVDKRRLLQAFFDALYGAQINADAKNHRVPPACVRTACKSALRSLGRCPSITSFNKVFSVSPTAGPAGIPACIKSPPFTASCRMV